MKKKNLLSLLSILTLSLTSCEVLNNSSSSDLSSSSDEQSSTETSSDDTLTSSTSSDQSTTSETESTISETESSSSEQESSISESSSSNQDSSSSSSTEYLYTEFSASEAKIFNDTIGFVVPFLANNSYEVTLEEDDQGPYVYYGCYEISRDEFSSYRNVLASTYTYDGSENDGGITYYFYLTGDIIIQVSLYQSSMELLAWDDNYDGGGQGGGSGSDTEGVIRNTGAGLPTSESGVYNVDFTKGNIKNVTELGDYMGGCPTVGEPNVLIIPVQFSDSLASSKGYTIDAIKKAFLPSSETSNIDSELDYYSVYDYFYQSSMQQLALDIDIVDEWFTPSHPSQYYISGAGSTDELGDQLVMNEALSYLDSKGYDLSQYDSDSNGMIDSVVIINTLQIDETAEVTMRWAYRYWNFYENSSTRDYYYYDNVCANDYLWASYQFLHETPTSFNGPTPSNTYTFIHEFSHVLGADDYYDTAGVSHPMEGYDIMDSKTADHSAFSKINYGWIKESKLIVADSSVDVTLNAFESSGDTIIIANDFNEKLGAYQEYWLVVYYNNTGLNGNGYGLFSQNGVVVYHIDASLYINQEYTQLSGFDYYVNAYNNTNSSDQNYGTLFNLIEFEKNGSNFVYTANSTLSSSIMSNTNSKIAYTFKVNSISDSSASLTFTKNN